MLELFKILKVPTKLTSALWLTLACSGSTKQAKRLLCSQRYPARKAKRIVLEVQQKLLMYDLTTQFMKALQQ